jgi:hypothetical protein
MYRSLVILIAMVVVGAAPSVAQDAAGTNSSSAAGPCEMVIESHSSVDTIERLQGLRSVVPASSVLLVDQFAERLRTRNLSDREHTLKDIIHIAANYGDLVDLNPLSADLLRVFAGDASPDRRIMAAHAISLIGASDANVELMRLAARDGSPEVRRFASFAAANVIQGPRAPATAA